MQTKKNGPIKIKGDNKKITNHIKIISILKKSV